MNTTVHNLHRFLSLTDAFVTITCLTTCSSTGGVTEVLSSDVPFSGGRTLATSSCLTSSVAWKTQILVSFCIVRIKSEILFKMSSKFKASTPERSEKDESSSLDVSPFEIDPDQAQHQYSANTHQD